MRRLAVRGPSAYWILDNGTVRTCVIATCAATLVTIATGYPKAGVPSGIAVDATHVYWTVNLNSTVFRAAPTAAAPVEAFWQVTPGSYPYGIGVDATNVYWTTQAPDQVRSCPANGPPCGDASVLLASSPVGFTRPLAMNDTQVFWLSGDRNDDAGAVFAVNKDGGAAVALRYDTPGPRGIAVHGNAAFVTSWLEPTGGAEGIVFRIGTTSTELARNQPKPSSIAVDDDNVYWANLDDGTIRRCAIAGCNSKETIFAVIKGTPESIAVDDNAVYVADTLNGKIIRIAK